MLVGWHKLWSLFLDPASGAAWALSIVGLTLVIRAALIPLFVKQIKSVTQHAAAAAEGEGAAEEVRPRPGAARRRRRWRSTRSAGTNPFASCLPILLQMPIFFALFRLLDQASHGKRHGRADRGAGGAVRRRRALRACRSPTTFLTPTATSASRSWRCVFVLAMLVTTFLTQRQLMTQEHAGRRR